MSTPALRLERLEDVSAPAVFTATIDPAADPAGAVAELVGFVNAANANAEPDTINLLPGKTYTFTAAADGTDGGTALPTVTTPAGGANAVTVNGNGSTFHRADGPATFRFFRATGKGASLALNDLTLSNGSVTSANGGAVRVLNGAALSANLVTFTGNAAQDGGAVDADQFGSPGFQPAHAFTACSFTQNKAAGDGGAVHNRFGAVFTFTGCVLSGNTAADGTGGVGSFAGTMTFTGSDLSGNQGSAAGAVNNVGPVSLTDCAVLGNVATAGGTGGISSSDAVTVVRSTIANNIGQSTVGSGGGIGAGQLVDVVDSTIHNNQSGQGGGISSSFGEVHLTHSEVTDNRSTFGIAGPGGVAASKLVAFGSIVAGNTNTADPGTSDIVDARSITSSGFNLFGVVPSGFAAGPGDQVGTKENPLNPRLGPLADNGGPTPTRMPMVGSPVIDAGGPTPAAGVTTDQRGQPRVANGVFDLGPVEVGPTDTLATPPANLIGAQQIAVGADAGGGPIVQLYNPDQSVRFATAAFDPAFAGGVRTAAADFNGDGVADVVVGTGPGAATHVRVLDGKDQHELFSIDPFEAAFTGGVFVAAGDVTGDGVADLVITPDEGGGPRVRVFDGKTFAQVVDFFGINDPNFRGGARAAVGDVNGDGVGDLLVAAGFGGGPRVAGFDGRTIAAGSPANLFPDFFAFETALRNGVFLTAGDIDGDGLAEVIAGGGPGGGPRVSAFGGRALVQQGQAVRQADFFAGDTSNRGGIRVAVKDLDGDGKADLVTGSGAGAGSRVTAYTGRTLAAGGTTPAFAFDAFPGFAGGVFVG